LVIFSLSAALFFIIQKQPVLFNEPTTSTGKWSPVEETVYNLEHVQIYVFSNKDKLTVHKRVFEPFYK